MNLFVVRQDHCALVWARAGVSGGVRQHFTSESALPSAEDIQKTWPLSSRGDLLPLKLYPRMQAGRSQDAKPWVQRAQRAILLTGTPATSRPKELYTLVGLDSSMPCVWSQAARSRSCCISSHKPAEELFWG